MGVGEGVVRTLVFGPRSPTGHGRKKTKQTDDLEYNDGYVDGSSRTVKCEWEWLP